MQQPNAGSTRARSALRQCHLCKLHLVAVFQLALYIFIASTISKVDAINAIQLQPHIVQSYCILLVHYTKPLTH